MVCCSSRHPKHEQYNDGRTVGTCVLITITYCLVAAGPYGIEEAVAASGPTLTVILMVLIALVLAFPISLIFSEMSNIFNQTGSTIFWGYDIARNLRRIVIRAEQQDPKGNVEQHNKRIKSLKHRRNLAILMSRLSANSLLLRAIVDNTTYLVLICDYLQTNFKQLSQWYYRIIVGVIQLAFVITLNFFGIDAVGWSQYMITFIIVTPAFLFVCLSIPYWNRTSNLSFSNLPPNINIGATLNNLIWQFAGFDQITNMSGDVKRPNVTYPISYFIVIILVLLTYLLTVVSGAMITKNFNRWYNGGLADLSLSLPGCSNGWLKQWLVIGGGISSIAIQNSSIFCTSRELYANAKVGLLPFGKYVAKLRSFRCKRKQKFDQDSDSGTMSTINITDQSEIKKQTDMTDYQIPSEEEMDLVGLVPWVAILIVSLLTLPMMYFPFSQLLEIDSFLFVIIEYIQLLFYFYARHGEYGYHNRNKIDKTMIFTVKGGMPATILIVICPISIIIFLIVTNGWLSIVIYAAAQCILFILVGIEYYIKNRKAKQSTQKEFESEQQTEVSQSSALKADVSVELQQSHTHIKSVV